jgi:hypothetical protein
MPRHSEWTTPNARLNGVDPRLLDIISRAADDTPYTVQITSGHNSRESTVWHPNGLAVDVQLYKDGKALPNLQHGPSFRPYEEFAQKAREIQQRDYPALANSFRWGGYFSGGGVPADLMHLDLGPTSAMGGGTWEGGATKAHLSRWPGATSVGMKSASPPDDDFFGVGAKGHTTDVWGDLEKGASARVGAATIPSTPSNDNDVWGDLEKRAATNAKPAPVVAEKAKPKEPAIKGSAITAATGGYVEGLPIVGPVLKSGAQKGAAFIRSQMNGTPYEQELANVQAFDKASQEQNKLLSASGHMVGAIAGTAPAMMAAPGAFGVTGANMLARMGASAATGAGIGAADSVPRQYVDTGEVSPMGVAKDATLGAVFGGAGPVAGDIIGAGARKAFDFANNALLSRGSGVSTPARNLLMDAINTDTPALVQAELQRLGPRGMLADVGSATQGLAQGTAIREGGTPLPQAIKDRAAGTQGRVRDAVAELGPAEDPNTVTKNILGQRKLVDSVNYPDALKNAPPVDVKRLVSTIDGLLDTAEGAQKTALQTLRTRLVEAPAQPAVPGRPTGLLDATGQPIISAGSPAKAEAYKTAAENLHNIKGELDSVINHAAPGLGVEGASVARQQGALRLVRGQLNDALETQVPGYAKANSASSALAKRAEAVESGTQVLSSGREAPTPERFAEEFTKQPLGVQVATAKGLIGEVNRLIGTKANDLGAVRTALQGEGGWNTAKMGTVLGEEPVNKLLGTVERETDFGKTYNAVVGNSQTAARTAAANALKEAAPTSGMDVSKMTGVGMMAGAAKAGINKLMSVVMQSDTVARDKELAKILSAQGPTRDAFVNALLNAQRAVARSPAVEKGAGYVGNLLTQGLGDAYRQEPGPLMITVNPRR